MRLGMLGKNSKDLIEQLLKVNICKEVYLSSSCCMSLSKEGKLMERTSMTKASLGREVTVWSLIAAITLAEDME